MVITSIAPSHHIIAKITAILAVAMTQIILVSLIFYIGFITSDSSNLFEALNIEIISNNKDIIYYGIIYWVLEVFSYTVLSSILGSLTSRIEDISQSIMPLAIFLLGSFYVVLFNIDHPESSLVRTTSFIPLVSPFSMLLRISKHTVEFQEIMISIFISVVFILISLAIAVFSYKSSVLSFDKNIVSNIRRLINSKVK